MPLYGWLAWLNVALLAVMVAPYLLRRGQKLSGRPPGEGYRSLMRRLRAVHKPLGGTVILVGISHGLLVFGGRLYPNTTGFFLWCVLLVTGTLGGLTYRTRRPGFLVAHRLVALVAILALLQHMIQPGRLF